MKRQYMPWYAAALAAALIGAVAVGVPLSTVLLLLVVLACPVMMMFMMGVMGGRHGDGPDQGSTDIGEHRDSADRP
ncbi:DUF2933 domain-containing protein [Mycobacterium barrassiae]|jgi:hypothetical protein|uniref:DUF2933 domain-containing protein n=1 Tax=Mycobacterium barrassiae TaxID=319709 RepID=UPI002265AD33|nr:DUF2933 domain-containing protein [Mycobacterium barrassiae]MCV7298169.1 DUF2933 domain-containing protein [Mycobacterium barrassiae]